MSLLSRVKTTAAQLPSRTFLYAREKWGKSSLFAHAPGAVFFMTRGETGLVELIGGGRVPATAHFPYDESAPPTWATLRQAAKELADEDHPYKLFVVDTANGAEILCQEHVRKTQFNNNQAKFASYGKGWEACRVEWLQLLADLDRLRAKRKMGVVLLAHTQVKKFEDPTTEDSYDKYRPACQEKLWELTHKWADIICFGHFQAQTYETDSGRTKARHELQRVLCFEQSPLWEAGNRYGIAGNLDVSKGAKAGFAAFAAAVKEARSRGPVDAPASPPPPVGASAPTSPPVGPPPPPPAADLDLRPENLPGPPAIDDAAAHEGVGDDQPAADRPRVGRQLAEEVLKLCHAVDLSWNEVRAEHAEDLGLTAAPVFEQDAEAMVSLRSVLKVKVEEKEKRRRKPKAEAAGATAEGGAA